MSLGFCLVDGSSNRFRFIDGNRWKSFDKMLQTAFLKRSIQFLRKKNSQWFNQILIFWKTNIITTKETKELSSTIISTLRVIFSNQTARLTELWYIDKWHHFKHCKFFYTCSRQFLLLDHPNRKVLQKWDKRRTPLPPLPWHVVILTAFVYQDLQWRMCVT